MKIKTKDTQVCEFASHETICFTTTLCVGEFDVAIVSNDGQGGCHTYMPIGGGAELTRNKVLLRFVEKYAIQRDPNGFEQLDALVYEMAGLL